MFNLVNPAPARIQTHLSLQWRMSQVTSLGSGVRRNDSPEAGDAIFVECLTPEQKLDAISRGTDGVFRLEYEQSN